MLEEAILIKLIIVGDGQVGKSCFVIRYTQGHFPIEYVLPVVDNCVSTIKVDGKMVSLGIWDTTQGAQTYRAKPRIYFELEVFLICFSVVDPASFINAIERWESQLSEYYKDVPKIFVGTQIDRMDQYEKINNRLPIMKEQARKKIEEELHCKYLECSSLTGKGICEVFEEAARIGLKSKELKIKENNKADSKCSLF